MLQRQRVEIVDKLIQFLLQFFLRQIEFPAKRAVSHLSVAWETAEECD